MGPRDRQRRTISALGHFWDALLQGRPAEPGDLDPSLAETVRHLHARDDVPGADADFTAKLSAQLEDQMLAMQPSQIRPTPPIKVSDLPSVNGRIPARSVWPPLLAAAPAQRRAWPVSHFVSAALVLLSLAVAFIALGVPRQTGSDNRLTGPPAAVLAPATPSPSAASDETLVTVTIPAGALPTEVVAGLNHYTVAAGSQGTWDWTCCTGVRLNYMLDGTYAITGTGPMQVRRAGSVETWQEVVPGTEVVLKPGDALLSRMEDGFDGANTGAAPAELLDMVLFAGSPIDDPVPYDASGTASWRVVDQDIWLLPVTVPQEHLTLRLRQTSIEAVSELPPPEGAIIQLAVSPDEGAVPSTQEDFGIKNFGPDPIGIYALTLEPAGSDASPTSSSPTP